MQAELELLAFDATADGEPFVQEFVKDGRAWLEKFGSRLDYQPGDENKLQPLLSAEFRGPNDRSETE